MFIKSCKFSWRNENISGVILFEKGSVDVSIDITDNKLLHKICDVFFISSLGRVEENPKTS